jgi:hypothetical protein
MPGKRARDVLFALESPGLHPAFTVRKPNPTNASVKREERCDEILRWLGFQVGRMIYASAGDQRTEEEAQADLDKLIGYATRAKWDELESLILDIKAMQADGPCPTPPAAGQGRVVDGSVLSTWRNGGQETEILVLEPIKPGTPVKVIIEDGDES